MPGRMDFEIWQKRVGWTCMPSVTALITMKSINSRLIRIDEDASPVTGPYGNTFK